MGVEQRGGGGGGGGVAVGTDSPLSVFNLKNSNTLKWRKALALARSGGARAHILVEGDSITQGYYADTPYYSKSFCGLLAGYLDSWVGASNATGVVPVSEIPAFGGPASEDRFVGPVSSTAWGQGFGGKNRFSTGATNTYTFTANCDTFRIHYERGSNGGTWSWSIDGGAPTTVNSNGASAALTTDCAAGSTASHTLTITSPASNYLFLNGVEAFTGANGGVKVSRVGFNGETSAKLVAGNASAGNLAAVVAAAPHLTILAMGVNDYGGQYDLATYNANLQAAVTAAQTTGDVLLLALCSQSSSLAIPYSSYVSEMQTVATLKNCVMLDLSDRWGTYAAANAAGLMADGTHPNSVGDYEIASWLLGFLKRLSG